MNAVRSPGAAPLRIRLIAALAALLMICPILFQAGLAQDAPDEGTDGPPVAEETGPPAQESGADEAQPVETDLPSVPDVRVSNTPDRARLVVDLATPTEFAFVSLTDPMRIAVDVRALGYEGQASGEPGNEGLISSYAVSQIGGDRLRTTLTLNDPAQVQQAYVLDPFDDQPARLIVDLIADTRENFAERAGADREAAAGDSASDVALADNSNAPGTSNVETETKPLILLDPGHGGADGGAVAGNGVQEKRITLAFARRLQEILIETGRFDVALTRDDDDFLRLEERVQLARKNRASLFVSIHADAFEDTSIRGATVYTRDEEGTDILDEVLAERENRADIVGGFAPPEAEPAVVDLLLDLMRRQTRRQSYLAADAIMDQLRPSIYVRRFPMRRADFFVLQSPEVPSILVELGFMSNGQDVENLTSPDWRDRVAEAVARGISLYFDGLAGT